mgnify:CR=1 FL=1
MTNQQLDPNQGKQDSQHQAEKAWESLASLMVDTPLEISAEWLGEIQVRWGAESHHLILHVPPGTDPLWMKKKFLPVANVFFSQQQGGQGQLLVEYEKTAADEEVRLKAERGAYESIVKPEKVLPVSVYMFQHWLPVLKPSAFWIALAMRQTAFVSKASSTTVGKRISTRDLARWIPIHYSNVSRALGKKDFLSWFFTKTDESYDDLAPEYSVYVQYHIAPHHIAWIDEFLQKGLSNGKEVKGVLHSLLDHTRELRRVRPDDIYCKEEYLNSRRSLADLASNYLPGKVNGEIYDLCNQLTSEIVRDYLTISIPHYFLLGYNDTLSSNEAALIWLLRSLYHEKDELLHSFKSYASLGDLVGVSYKTIKRMLARCPRAASAENSSVFEAVFYEEKELGNWICVQDQDEISDLNQGFSLLVRSGEPILPQHEEEYFSLVDQEVIHLNSQSTTPSGQNATPRKKNGSGRRTQIATLRGQKATPSVQSTTGVGQSATTSGQAATQPPDSPQHLNSSLKSSFNQPANQPVKPPLQEHQLDFWEMQQVLEEDPDVVVVNLEKLLGFDGFSQKEKNKLIPEINKKETLFLAWVMRNHLTGADFPARLAIRNMQENNTTESKYLKLASKGWERVFELLKDDFELLNEKEEIQEIIKKLRETELLDVLKDILPERTKPSNDELFDLNNHEEEKFEEKEIEPIYKHGWEVVKGELQLEMKRNDFDTWVSSIELVEANNGKFVFKTSNAYARDWLDQNLEKLMVKKLSPLVKGNGEKARVKFVSR